MSTDNCNIQAAIDAGKAQVVTVERGVKGVPYIVSADRAQVFGDLLAQEDARADKPRRRRGTAQLQTIDSFCSHVERFASPSSAIFADGAHSQFVGVLDYHPAGADSDPAWGQHRAHYSCAHSPEWQVWGAGREIEGTQDEFAAFLDEHDRDLAAGVIDATGTAYPAPADLMTFAATLETYSSASAKRIRDPRTGRIAVEYKSDAGIVGTTPIPRAFAVRIPIFADSDPVAVEVRLRVTVENGRAEFSWQIHDAPKVLRAAFARLVERVRETTGLPVFVGTPEQ